MSPFLLFFFTILFLPPLTYSQTNGNITVGASIAATETSTPWYSPSGDFAFGFQQLPNNKELFVLSIWFDKIPDKTIIWYNKNGTKIVNRGSTVQLDSTNGLVLRDPQGGLIWSTADAISPDRIAYAYMNNSGNFVLFRSDSSSVWESFKNPTDTLLLTQTLEINSMLVSRRSESNFSEGRFYARMLNTGDFVFNTKSVSSNVDFDDEYYNSLTSDSTNSLNSGFQVVFNERGSLLVRRRNGQFKILTPRSIPTVSENYYRATLNFDGVLTQYYHRKNGDPGWNAVSSWPDNICLSIEGGKGSGACGYNSVCNLENQRPVCKCPRGFSLIDPNDSYGDCQSKLVASCLEGEKGSANDLFELLEISDVDWPQNDYEQINPSTEKDCKDSCLNDCLCGAAIFRSNSCWKKRLPLSNGKVDTALAVKAFLKFRKSDVPLLDRNPISPPDKQENDKSTLVLVGSLLLGSSVFINVLLLSACSLGFFLVYKKKLPIFYPVRDASGSNLICYTYKELVQATNGFKEELGRGAFGIVYKGIIPNKPESIVAVKKLNNVGKGSEKEFRTEVNVIGQTHHKNLVRLIGFCDEGDHRMLVYEYMSNGTLADFLFGDPKPSWSLRTQMALGVAKALAYLHEECTSQIIHCDIKPQNVLLDEYYNARISDFGLAKLLMMDQSRTVTNIRGTKGYIAPEWFRNVQITVKVDVYSFGVLLLETISCEKSIKDLELEEGEGEYRILTDWIWDCFHEKRLDTLVENDEEALSDMERLERFVRVGIWCVQEDASLRPTMRKASQMLEGSIEVEAPPCPLSFNSSSFS